MRVSGKDVQEDLFAAERYDFLGNGSEIHLWRSGYAPSESTREDVVCI